MKKLLMLLFALAIVLPTAAQEDCSANKKSILGISFGKKSKEKIQLLNHKVENGKVVFFKVIENIPLTAQDIYTVAEQFMADSYKLAKYRITQKDPTRLYIVGQGEFLQLATYSYYPNNFTFSCVHDLRIDAKDGRLRIAFTVDAYDVLKINGNKRDELTAKIAEVAPVADTDKDRKMYEKAFEALQNNIQETFDSLEEQVMRYQPASVGEW